MALRNKSKTSATLSPEPGKSSIAFPSLSLSSRTRMISSVSAYTDCLNTEIKADIYNRSIPEKQRIDFHPAAINIINNDE